MRFPKGMPTMLNEFSKFYILFDAIITFLLKSLLNLLDLELEGRHHSGIGFCLVYIKYDLLTLKKNYF